jgi:dihydrofolate synthase/folylpolyglutamate synthase
MKPSERTQSSHSTSRGGTPPSWTLAEAEAHLASLELFGMRFGLDRMRRMMTVLGSPQQSFDAIHIVGTNGKTSTTRMLAAILERHGMRTGAYTSPHLLSYCERLQLGEHDIEADAFAGAIARAAWAAERVNRTLAEDDRVTQFELLTAAALWAIAERGVQVAAVEAGLGGRYDATSVIAADVTVLTNIGLEHTRWLGPTLRDIAEEKLAVLPARTTLVLGEDLAPEALAVARRVAAERRARIAPVGAEPPVPPLLAGGSFQRLNFAQASAAAGAYLRTGGGGLSERAVAEAAASTEVPGRLQLLDEDPPTVLDGAHNPAAARALRASLPGVLGGGPLALVLGVLEDKDAARMLDTLLPVCERAWFTAPPGPRALPPPALQSLARQLGFEAASSEPRPARALDQARLWARERGGGVLVTGSIYLVGDLLLELAPAGAQAPTARPRRSRG